MIKTSIMGLGNIGYFYDVQNPNKKLTHFSSINKSNNFKLVSLADKNLKILKYLKKNCSLENDIFEKLIKKKQIFMKM